MLAKVCSAAVNGIEAYPSKWKSGQRHATDSKAFRSVDLGSVSAAMR